MTDDKLPPWLSDNADDESEDNDLPDWLKDADDDDSLQSSTKTGMTGELSWMQDVSPDDTPKKGRASTGLTGELSWMQDDDAGDDNSPKGRASTGLTGELSWNQDDSADFLDDATEGDSDPLPDWLTVPDNDENSGLPDWLDDDELESERLSPQQQFTMTDEMTVVDFLDDEQQSDSDEIPAWLMDDSSSNTEEAGAIFADETDMSNWGDWQGGDTTSYDDDQQATAFTDDSWIQETETPSLEEDFADLFGESAPITDFNPTDLPTTGMLFGDDDFSLDSEETFDLLGTPGDIDNLLGSDDFDLLGELADDKVSDEFDLFGELSDELETPIADALASDDQFMAQYAQDDDDIFGADGNVDIGALLGEEEDPFREFETSSEAPFQDDLSWLEDISNVPFQDTQPEPLFPPEMRQKLSAQLPQSQSQPQPEADLDDFLAGLDDVSLDDIIPDSDLEAGELDFESFFEDDAQIGIAGLSPDAPSWLTDLSAVSAGENSAAAIISAQKDRPAEDLPDRMKALRERGFEVQSKPKTDDEVLSAIMPTSPVTMTDMTDSAIATVTLTAGQVQRAELLRTIVGNALEADESREKKRRAVRLPIERVFITAILLLAVLAPFFIDNLAIGTPPQPQFVFGSRQWAFYQILDSVPVGEYVLIATEYGAMGAGELDIATESVLRHVLAHGATPIIISSDAVGLVRVTNMMTAIAKENALISNRDYVVVRYLVTDVVGLRDFSQNIDRYLAFDVDGNPTRLQINSLNDFARVVIITESADNLRLWGEQVLPLMTNPFVAVTSYSASPLSEPYLNTRSGAYLTGYSDAFTYQTMVNRMLGGETIEIIPPTIIPIDVQTEDVIPTTEIPLIIPPEITSEATSAVELTAIVTPSVEMTQSVTVVETTTQSPVATPTAPQITPTTETPVATATLPPTFTPTPSPTPSPTPIVQRFAIITASTPINIRPDPSTSNPPVGVLSPDDRALIVAEVTGADLQIWYNITFQNNAGQTIVGWVRQDLVRLEEVIVTPTPTITPSATTTQSASSRKTDMRVFARVSSPRNNQEVTPETTPNPEITAETTPSAEITAEVTVEVVIPPISTVIIEIPEMPDLSATPRIIAPMDITDRQARWDSLALGILVAVMVIVAGNLFNLVRVIFRKRRR